MWVGTTTGTLPIAYCQKLDVLKVGEGLSNLVVAGVQDVLEGRWTTQL